MKTESALAARTLAVTLCARRAEVFNFLADVENLPRWAASFCERIEIFRGRWMALTIDGELFVELEADERSGAIDLRLGDAWQWERVVPLRVMTLPGGQALVSAVFYPVAQQSEIAFERQCEALTAALNGLDETLARRVSSMTAPTAWLGALAC